jgi:HlyD family secretion protein
MVSSTQTAHVPVQSSPPVREAVPIEQLEQPQTTWAPLPPAPDKTRRSRRRAVVGLAAAALAGLSIYGAVLGLGGSDDATDIQLFKVTRRSFPVVLQEKGELKAAHITDVRCELEGKSTIIFLVPEGSRVKKGELLVELASDEIDEKIREADIKVATTKAAYEAAQKELQITQDKNASDISKAELAVWVATQTLKKYEEGEAFQLQQTDDLALKKAEYVLDRAEKKLKDSNDLYKKGFITRLELESDEFDQRQAEMDLKKAQTAVKVTKEYTIPIALEQKKSDVEEAKKELKRTQSSAQAAEAKGKADVDAKERDYNLNADKFQKLVDQKSKAKIPAPTDGLVVYYREDWDEEPRIKVGAQVVERQRMIQLPDTTQMKVALRVHEAKVERLRKGLPATVQIEGFTGRQFTGQISNIAVLAEAQHWFNRNLKEYETDVLLDGTFSELKPGVTARADILLTELKNVLAVPVYAVFGKGGKYFVFVDVDGQARPVEVKVGLSSTEFVAIKEGLKEGDMVRLAVTEEMKLKLPQNQEPQEESPRPHRRPASRPAEASAPASRPASPSPAPVPASRPAVAVVPT